MTSVKRKKKLRHPLFWESEGKLVNNHRLKRWLSTVWTAVDKTAVFCLIPVVFQYALGNPLFFLFTADVFHDTEEYGIYYESKYCKQYKHNMDNYIIGKIYYA